MKPFTQGLCAALIGGAVTRILCAVLHVGGNTNSITALGAFVAFALFLLGRVLADLAADSANDDGSTGPAHMDPDKDLLSK